ncbi:MAG: hypothetical protein HQK69_04010 [Desulfamplus sp.]|nr:hypothetical protein [Desulfamplus sp.]
MKKTLFLLMLVLLTVFFEARCFAKLSTITEETIVDSQESPGIRIYAYDFDVSKNGTIHCVYTEPIPNTTKAKIIYTSKLVSTKDKKYSWSGEKKIVLEESGSAYSISTYLIVDDNDVVHICYIVDGTQFIDHNHPDYNGYTSGLVYQTIIKGVVQPKINIASGTFHTKMQLNKYNQPIFLREYEIFADSQGNLLTPPFKKALKMFIPSTTKKGTWEGKVINLETSDYYRLANFIYDKNRNKYHILYGNGNSDELMKAYPTTHPPATKGVVFPSGAGHQLWYAFSSDLNSWKMSQVDHADSGNLSENEFWTELAINKDGIPYASYYHYATDSNGIHQGTSNLIGSYSQTTNSWTMKTVAGQVNKPFLHRAGMGMGIIEDKSGGFHGVWDNSPDMPIDADGDGGNIMYHYSPDGVNWNVKQAIHPYSCEGYARIKIYQNTFMLMALADARDRRLIFSEFEIPDNESNLMEISTDKMFYGNGETINFNARVQSSSSDLSDIYIVCAGPYDKDANGNFIPTNSTQYAYLSSELKWKTVPVISDFKPIINGIPLFNFNGYFLAASAGLEQPFNKPSRYVIVSFANKNNANFLSDLITPLFLYELHICRETDCSEL